MKADADAVSGAVDVVRVGAGKAAIVRDTAGLPAVVRIPVVSGVVISHDAIKSATVVILTYINIIFSRADSLIVDLDIFCLIASLVNFEDLV